MPVWAQWTLASVLIGVPLIGLSCLVNERMREAILDLIGLTIIAVSVIGTFALFVGAALWVPALGGLIGWGASGMINQPMWPCVVVGAAGAWLLAIIAHNVGGRRR